MEGTTSASILERAGKTINPDEYKGIHKEVSDFFANHPEGIKDLCDSYDKIAENYEMWMDVLKNMDPIHVAHLYQKH